MSPVPASNNSSVPSSVIHGGGGDTTPPGIYYTVGTVMTVGSLVGVFFNGMALVVFAKHKHLRTPTNSFVMALCGCDLFMCLIGMPIAATYSWRMRPIESEAVCVFDAFAVYFLGLSSMYLLAAISVDRYIVIVRPLASSSVTHRMSSLAIGMCFLFGLFWTTMPLLGWNRYTQEGIGVQCSVEWESGDSAVTSYIFSIFVFCFLLPLTVMVFCYANIYKAIRNIARNSPWGPNSHVAQNNYRLEKKMLRTVVIMIGAFLISWVPYAIVSFLETFTARHVVSDVVETFPAIIAKCSAIWNPIIYIATNIQFRRAFFAMCPCCEAFLGYCASDEDSVGSETQIGPESRAPVPDISSRVRQVGEVGGGGGGRGLSEKSAKVRAAGKDGNCNPGVCHETITLDTRVSISPENVKQKRGSARGNGGSVRSGGDGGGKGVKQAFDRMPDVETNCSSKRANVEV